jgi:sulfatase modifying factor 1
VLIWRTVAFVTSFATALIAGACGGKTERDWVGTRTAEPSGSAGTGGTVSNGVSGGVAGAAGSSGSVDCVPNCEGKECGDDGCGRPCAPGCSVSQTCNAGQCDDVVYGPEGPSCTGMTGTECNSESCCASIAVPGGTFAMGRGTESCDGCSRGCPSGVACEPEERPEHPATVSSFALDRYEVTVGRFRAFVDAAAGTQGSPPEAGAGAHPLIPGSGWDSAWNTFLPADQATLMAWVSCEPTEQTWTDMAGANETYPMNCVSWYEAFAFCIWDGGRLPTEAEWEYAAAGGEENRVYPWGNNVTEPLPANYMRNHATPLLDVGSEPLGNGRWGHADLAGSMSELIFDGYSADWYTTTRTGCSDCADLSTASYRGFRGGNWASGPYYLRAAHRSFCEPDFHIGVFGFRCSRSAE